MTTPPPAPLSDAEVAAFKEWISETMAHSEKCAFFSGSQCNCLRNIADRLVGEWEEQKRERDEFVSLGKECKRLVEQACDERDEAMQKLAAANARIAELELTLESADDSVTGITKAALLSMSDFIKIRTERDQLRQQLADRDAEILKLRSINFALSTSVID